MESGTSGVAMASRITIIAEIVVFFGNEDDAHIIPDKSEIREAIEGAVSECSQFENVASVRVIERLKYFRGEAL